MPHLRRCFVCLVFPPLLVEEWLCFQTDRDVVILGCFLAILGVKGRSCCSKQGRFCSDSKYEFYLLCVLWWWRCWGLYICCVVPYFWGSYYFFLGFSLLCDPECLVSMNVLISSSNWASIVFRMSPTFLAVVLSEFIDRGVVIPNFRLIDETFVKCFLFGFSSAHRWCAVHWYGMYIC